MEGTAWVGAGVWVLEWMERRSVCTGVNWGTTEKGGGVERMGGAIEKGKKGESGEKKKASLCGGSHGIMLLSAWGGGEGLWWFLL